MNRLQWKLETPPECLQGVSTAHSLAKLLNLVGNVASVVVFLDLENAFELAGKRPAFKMEFGQAPGLGMGQIC